MREFGYEVFSIDVDGAYLQAKRRGPPTYLVLPAELMALLPLAVRETCAGMRTPAFQLNTPIYGETDAGDDWAAFLEEVLTRLGWRRLEAAGGEQLFLKELPTAEPSQPPVQLLLYSPRISGPD